MDPHIKTSFWGTPEFPHQHLETISISTHSIQAIQDDSPTLPRHLPRPREECGLEAMARGLSMESSKEVSPWPVRERKGNLIKNLRRGTWPINWHLVSCIIPTDVIHGDMYHTNSLDICSSHLPNISPKLFLSSSYTILKAWPRTWRGS